MARIRSVHPTLFTDEAWVSCSPLARVFYIGLMTDADDQGLFEWKPLQLRMRLLPGDNADVPGLLGELVAANLIASLESGGKKLGAIRYFRRFQRPKKPTSTFSLPSEWRTYVGLSADGSELAEPEVGSSSELTPIEPPPVPPKSEIAPQMEDGGWRMDKEEDSPVALFARERSHAVLIEADGTVVPMEFRDRDDDGDAKWGLRLADAHLAAAGGIDLTRGGVHLTGPLKALCEPASGEPCRWEEVLEAIRACAGKAKATGDPLHSWTPVKWAALAIRDARLNSHLPPPKRPHEQPPRTDERFARKQDNLARANAGFDRIAGPRERP